MDTTEQVMRFYFNFVMNTSQKAGKAVWWGLKELYKLLKESSGIGEMSLASLSLKGNGNIEVQRFKEKDALESVLNKLDKNIPFAIDRERNSLFFLKQHLTLIEQANLEALESFDKESISSVKKEISPKVETGVTAFEKNLSSSLEQKEDTLKQEFTYEKNILLDAIKKELSSESVAMSLVSDQDGKKQLRVEIPVSNLSSVQEKLEKIILEESKSVEQFLEKEKQETPKLPLKEKIQLKKEEIAQEDISKDLQKQLNKSIQHRPARG